MVTGLPRSAEKDMLKIPWDVANALLRVFWRQNWKGTECIDTPKQLRELCAKQSQPHFFGQDTILKEISDQTWETGAHCANKFFALQFWKLAENKRS
jgi:hypothetical protein